MFLRKLCLNPKNIATERFNGCMSLGNLKFYKKGLEVVPEDIKTLDTTGTSCSFTLDGIKGTVTAVNPYSSALGVYNIFAKNWTTSKYLRGKDLNDVEGGYRNCGVFFEFERNVQIDSISFNYGTTTVADHADNWEIYAHDDLCIKKGIMKQQSNGQDIHNVSFKVKLLESKETPGLVYYIQGVQEGITTIDFRPLSLGSAYSSSFSVGQFKIYDDNDTPFTFTLNQEVSGYEAMYNAVGSHESCVMRIVSKKNYDTGTYKVRSMIESNVGYGYMLISYISGLNPDGYTVHVEFSEPIKVSKIEFKDWADYPTYNGSNFEFFIDRDLDTEKHVTGINPVSNTITLNLEEL